MICKIVSVNAPWDLSPIFFRLRLSYAPHTSELYRRTGANKESNKKLHLDIESFFQFNISFTSKYGTSRLFY